MVELKTQKSVEQQSRQDPALYRQVKANAALRGVTVRQWLKEAIEQKLQQERPDAE